MNFRWFGVVSGAALLLCMGCSSVLAPLRIESAGKITSSTRMSLPDEGESSLSQAWTAELGLGSYIIQPWVALWSTQVGVSLVDTDGESESSALSVTGNGQLRLFPRSRFPMNVFADVRDSRVETESSNEDIGQDRFIRYGLSQQYQTLSGGTSLMGRVEQDSKEDLSDGTSDSATHASLSMSHYRKTQKFFVDFDLLSRQGDANDTENLDWTLTSRHSFNPGRRFSLDSALTFESLDQDSESDEESSMDIRFKTAGLWRSENHPLRVSGNLDITSASSSNVSGDSTSESGSLATSASYDFSSYLHLSGGLGVNYQSGDDATTSSSQNASLSFSPASVDLRGFRYHYSASGTVANDTSSESDSTLVVGLNAGHGLSRRFSTKSATPWTLVVSGNQNVTGDENTTTGSQITLNHQASTSLAHSTKSTSSELRMSARDSRLFGEEASDFQSVNTNLSFSKTMNRYSSWGGNFQINYGRSAADEDDSSNGSGGSSSDDSSDDPNEVSSGVELQYRHQRLFSVRGLQFNTLLRLDSDTYFPTSLGENPGDDLSWEAGIRYVIGRLGIRLKTTLGRANSIMNQNIHLTVSRSF